MWWTTKVKNTSNGKEYIRGECGFLSLPTFLKEFVIASHGAAAATESMRNHFILGIDEIKKLNEENHRQLELENAGR